MASKIKVDQIVGSTGNTVTFPAGQTVTITDGLTVAGGGTGLASFTAGDVLYATGTTTLAKLPKGTAEQILSMNSGATLPEWTSADISVLPTITVAKGGTGQAGGFTQGDILYATDATTLAKLAKGTASQTLKMNAGATAPEWATVAAASSVYEKITSASFTVATTMDITDAAWGSGYDTHEIHLHIYSGGSGTGGNLRFKFSDDDGSSWETSLHSSHSVHLNSSGSGGVTGYSVDAGDYIHYGGDGFSPSWGFAIIRCSGLTNTQQKMFQTHYTRTNQDGATRMICTVGGGCVINTSSSNNQLQFSNSAGHDIIGRYVVYGIKG